MKALFFIFMITYYLHSCQPPTLKEIAIQTDEYIYTPQLHELAMSDIQQTPASPVSSPSSSVNGVSGSVDIEIGHTCCFKVKCKCKCKKAAKDAGKVTGGIIAGIIAALLAL